MRTDPVTLEIMRNYYNSITNGMGYVLERTSFTTFIKESADFATAIATPGGEFFSYPKNAGVTIFVGLNLKTAVEACGHLEEGDIIFTNDPYTTDGLASHLPDLHIIKPVFYQGEIISYAWAFVHCSDIGGLVPASISPRANDIHQEGLRVPPVKLYQKGKLDESVKNIIMANSRIPDLNYGDINAMIASTNTAENRILEMIDKFGLSLVRDSMIDLVEQAETRTKKIFNEIPNGDYEFSDYLDDDMVSDIPLRLAVKMSIQDHQIELDFSDSDPQVGTAFNLVTNGTAHSFLLQGLINFIFTTDPEIPINGGMTRPIKVTAPRGSIVNPEYPAAVGTRHPVSARLYNVILGALSKVLPDKVPSAGAGQAAIIVLSTPDEDTGVGRKISVVEPMTGGSGGQNDMDGIDGVDHVAAFLKNTPIEILEQHVDILIDRYELAKDTAGPGLHRGGYGVKLEFQIIKNHSIVTARGMERMRFQPWGLSNGKAGSVGRAWLKSKDSSIQDLSKIDVLHLSAGDKLSIYSPGGGGWGHPFDRDPQLVLNDVRAGLLSEDKAREHYGVVITETDNREFIIELEATEEFRNNKLINQKDYWDFGTQRKMYESKWNEKASNALAHELQAFPASQREYYKHLIHKAFNSTGNNGVITPQMVKSFLEKHKAKMKSNIVV